MAEGIIEALRYFAVKQKYDIKEMFVYRLQTVLWIIVSVVIGLMGFIAITAVYNVSNGIAGWGYFQVLLLSSTASIMMGIMYFLVPAWQVVMDMIAGRIDVYMVRPYGRMTVMFTKNAGLTDVVGSLTGAVIFAYAALSLGLGAQQVLLYAVLFAFGMAALMCFMFMLTVLVYHLFKSARFVRGVFEMAQSVANYPIGVFGVVGQILFSTLLPVGIAYYYPVGFALGMISPEFIVAYVGACIAIAAVCYKLFYVLIREYTSGGG